MWSRSEASFKEQGKRLSTASPALDDPIEESLKIIAPSWPCRIGANRFVQTILLTIFREFNHVASNNMFMPLGYYQTNTAKAQ